MEARSDLHRQILTLHKKGQTQAQIQKSLKCSRSMVYRVLSKKTKASAKPVAAKKDSTYQIIQVPSKKPDTEVRLIIGSPKAIADMLRELDDGK